jgi:hypothetical protein
MDKVSAQLNICANKSASQRNGYVALVSAIVITALLSTICFVFGFSNFFNRFNVLDTELKEISLGLAEACADTAILKLAEDPNYGGGETVAVGSNNCKIISVDTSGVQKIIKTQANFKNYFTNLEITVTPAISDIIVNSWEEVPNF